MNPQPDPFPTPEPTEIHPDQRRNSTASQREAQAIAMRVNGDTQITSSDLETLSFVVFHGGLWYLGRGQLPRSVAESLTKILTSIETGREVRKSRPLHSRQISICSMMSGMTRLTRLICW